MNTSSAAAALRTRTGTSPFERTVSILSRGLIDRNNNVVLDGDVLTSAIAPSAAVLPASPIAVCAHFLVSLAALKELGAVTSGNVVIGNLPAKGVISQAAWKHSTALTGGSAKATQTLTSDATAPADGEQVVIGNKTYTFKTALTPTEGQVLIGGSAAVALDNLKAAINHTGTPDTDYKCAAAHTQVTATTNTNTTQVVEAIAAGTGGNALVTTDTSSHLSWGGATLSGGGAVTLTAATARLITANTNYGSGVLDVFQAVGNTALIFHDTPPKKENFAAVTELRLAMALTGANANELVTGAIDVWVLYYVWP